MKTSKYRAVPLTAGLVLAVVTAAVPAAAQSHHAPTAQRVTLTNADNGRSVALAAGDDVSVTLTGYRSQGLNYTWSIPRSSAPDVLHRTAGGTTPTGSASGVLHADHLGVATITGTRHCRPDPGRICPGAVLLWKVTAEVK
ncbi:hypothetical protein ACT1U9_05125 [Streptomyces sp. BR1]|uniref:hypothetical protein n=1 Tax=Streptomyces sp. BR1 TaxID=1592323 RepID=UPI00402B766B